MVGMPTISIARQGPLAMNLHGYLGLNVRFDTLLAQIDGFHLTHEDFLTAENSVY